jgi:outer membrane protein OmpA-like peptidoglycan-associated protein
MLFRAATLGLLLFLAACYGLQRVEQLREAPRAATPFHQELARLYLQFVDNELDKYDWDAAGYFAAKGLDAAKGQNILPEDPAQWNIPDYAREELAAARMRVMAKLTPRFTQSQPKTAASMLFHYDCWVEEQEEAWETAAIDACRQQVFRQFAENDPPVPMGGPLSTSYLFHFPEGAATLEGMARDELGLIAQTLSELGGGHSVLINGHADQPELAALSKRRADYIRGALKAGGVASSRIDYHPYSDTAAPNAGGAAPRIEIFIE